MDKLIILPENQVDRFIWKVYNLSEPVGMGAMVARKEDLTELEIDNIRVLQSLFNSKRPIEPEGRVVLDFDYLRGRRIKIKVWRNRDGDLVLRSYWESHSQEQFIQLLEFVGIKNVRLISVDVSLSAQTSSV